MSYSDIIGAVGVGIILLAYFFSTAGALHPHSKLFYFMNTVGAGLACYASCLINYVPFIVMEGTWTLVSVYGLIKAIVKKHQFY